MTPDIVNPLEVAHWDDLLLTNTKADFFHSTAWARVLSLTYGYKPLFVTIIEKEKLIGLLPVMSIDSFLTGRRGVSLPFTDYCQPIASNENIFKGLLDKALAYGRKARWKTLEIRGGESYFKTREAWACYYTHKLSLGRNEDQISKSFRPSTLRNARRAENSGVQVHRLNTHSAMTTFYDLHCKTRRRHNLPPPPWLFFKNIFRHIIAHQKGSLFLATHANKPIAAAVFLHFNHKAIYKYGASEHKMLHLRPNNLLMWKAIQWFCANGIHSLHFGRTDLDHYGLRQFKSGWGTMERQVSYFKFNLKQGPFLLKPIKPKFTIPLFRHLPIPLLKLAGGFLYKHIG